MKIWIRDYITGLTVNDCHYLFYEYLSGESAWFEERRRQLIPADYEERRQAYMLEF